MEIFDTFIWICYMLNPPPILLEFFIIFLKLQGCLLLFLLGCFFLLSPQFLSWWRRQRWRRRVQTPALWSLRPSGRRCRRRTWRIGWTAWSPDGFRYWLDSTLLLLSEPEDGLLCGRRLVSVPFPPSVPEATGLDRTSRTIARTCQNVPRHLERKSLFPSAATLRQATGLLNCNFIKLLCSTKKRQFPKAATSSQ